MMISALVIDNEPQAAGDLIRMIGENCPQVQVLAGITEAKGARNAVIDLNPDLVFLNIEMPYLPGFELFEQSVHGSFSVIFTATRDQYVLKPIKCPTLGCLLKPIDVNELKDSIKKLHPFPRRRSFLRGVNDFRAQEGERFGHRRLPVPDHKGISFIFPDNLIYLKADKNYTILHLTNGKTIVSTRTLKEYELQLHHLMFYRVHHSYLVNLSHVDRYENDGYLLLTGDKRVEIARRRKADLLKFIGLH